MVSHLSAMYLVNTTDDQGAKLLQSRWWDYCKKSWHKYNDTIPM